MSNILKYMDCPINENFYAHLEYILSMTFEKSNKIELKGFWCDGVSEPMLDTQLSKNNVNDKQKIVTKAWIGKDGQSEYEMTIHFGKYTKRRYAKGTSITDCIPSTESMDWIDIDTKNKKIELRLL